MIYAQQMNKSNLDRSSRSVIDSYKEKFRLSNQNLEALRQFLLTAQSTADELKTIIDQQVIDMKEQVDDAIDEAENFCQNGDAVIETLEEIDDALDNVEDDLSSLEDDIQEQLDCLDACYGSCQNEQGNACTTGCEISLDCGESIPCNEGGYSCTGPNDDSWWDSCEANADSEFYCKNLTVDDDLCFTMEIACTKECQSSGEGVTCLFTSDKNCTDYGEASCVQVGELYCAYSGEDACVFPGERGCSYEGETGCGVGDDTCWAIGLEDCQYAGELSCTMAGELGCEQVGELSCIQIGEDDCIYPGEYGCKYSGEASCVEVGEDILCFTLADANACGYAGEDDCQAAGEADCGFPGEDWKTCDQPVLVACDGRWGTCGSTNECPPAFGEAAECGTSQGCGTVETCGDTCNTTCANCEAACTGTCNTTCANGECSSGECGNCTGSCNTTCANGEGCGSSQTCTGCGLEGGCEGCTGTCQSTCANGECSVACTTGICTICTGSIYQ